MALADFTVAPMCLRAWHDVLTSRLPRADAAFEEAAEGGQSALSDLSSGCVSSL